MSNNEKNIYPSFISKKPAQEDVFEGKPHKRLAETIAKLINREDNSTLDNKVIGLEGDWGSGKSTVIELLNKKLNKNK